MKDNQLISAKSPSWKGYTLEEIKYRRLLALTRLEIEKAKLLDAGEVARETLPFVGNSSAGMIFKSINKIEYIILAVKLIRKIAPLFRRTRR